MLNIEELKKSATVVRDNEIAVCGVVLGKVDNETAKVIAALATGSLTVDALRNSVPAAPKAPAPTKSEGKGGTRKAKPFDTSKLKDVTIEWGRASKMPGENAKGYFVTFGSLKRDCYAVIANKVTLAGGQYDKTVKGFVFKTKKAAEEFMANNSVVTAAERKAVVDGWEARKAAREA